MRSRRSGSGRPLGDTKESDRRVTCKAPLGPTWNEGQASPRRRPQPFSRILTAWNRNSRKFTERLQKILQLSDTLVPLPRVCCVHYVLRGRHVKAQDRYLPYF